jgi:GNAT superfamily N-acetyltransferase
MDATIRRGTAEDAPTLARMRWNWRVEERGQVHGDRDMFLRFFTTWTIDHLATHVPFVADVDGRLAGMAWLHLTDRVPSPSRMDRRTADIQSVYVIPDLRNRGIGGQILMAILREAHARELERVTVHSGVEAIAFYRRWGFDDDGQWLQYSPGDDR